jgi:riboflavin kinase/FMN adenylyltransferase
MEVIDLEISGREGGVAVASSHVYAIGMFDGVHLGHRQVVLAARALAEDLGVCTGVVTFDRHPSAVTGSGCPGRFLMTTKQRLESLAELGPDTVVILPFDEKLAAMSPRAFVTGVLLKRLSLVGAVVGENHTFGRGASGRAHDLTKIGADLGFEVVVVPSVMVDGVVVSSTLIRSLIGAGDVAGAARYLGRPFAVDGVVIEGRRLGKRLGYPTMNLGLNSEQALPTAGVYVVSVVIDGDTASRWGICNVGSRPTVSAGGVTVEVHVLDFDGESYGKSIRVSFLSYVREEKRFASLQQLKEAIASDEESARRWIAAYTDGASSSVRHELDLQPHRSVIK